MPARNSTLALCITRAEVFRRNAAAQFNLGLMYRNGQGVSKDASEALHWFSLAAAQGYPGAQANLEAPGSIGTVMPQARFHALMDRVLARELGGRPAAIVLKREKTSFARKVR